MSAAVLPGGQWAVGLPGNPLAALVAYLTLAAPLLHRLRNEEQPSLRRVAGPNLPAHPDLTRLAPVQLREGAAEPVESTGSAMLRGVAGADAIAVVDPGGRASAPADSGGRVRLLPLGAGTALSAG